MFVAVVGPDGVGKTSVADHVVAAGRGRALYFHFCPTPEQPLRPFVHLGDEPAQPPVVSDGNRVLGVVRLCRNLARFWLAYLIHIRPALRRGSLVVADRWGYGYQASPHPLRFYGPRWLGLAAVRMMPRPRVVINLKAEPSVIRNRKDDLDLATLERELRGWGSIEPERRVDVDATEDLESVVGRVLEVVEDAGWSP